MKQRKRYETWNDDKKAQPEERRWRERRYVARARRASIAAAISSG